MIEKNPLLHSFGHHFRTLCVTVNRLQVRSGWMPYGMIPSDDDPPNEPSVFQGIDGVATIGEDSLVVIGTDIKNTREMNFRLNAFPSWQALKDGAAKHRSEYGHALRDFEAESNDENGEKFKRYLMSCYDRFEKKPATAYIVFRRADWELGTQDTWAIEASVPKPVLDAIVVDVFAGRCDSLNLHLTLNPTLCDSEHAPPSVPVAYGLIRRSRHDSGSAQGWCDYVGWSNSPSSTVDSSNYDSDDGSATDRSNKIERRTIDPAIAREVTSLTHAVRRGFILILILLGILALFR